MKLFNLLLTCIIIASTCVDNAAAGGEAYRMHFKDWIVGFKGWMNGLNRGFYKDEDFQLDKDCLGTIDTNSRLIFLQNFVRGKESPEKVLPFVNTFVSLINT